MAITLALLTLQIVLGGKVLHPQKILFNVTYVEVYTSSEMRGLGMTGTVCEDPARGRGPFKGTGPYTELDIIVKQEGKCTIDKCTSASLELESSPDQRSPTFTLTTD